MPQDVLKRRPSRKASPEPRRRLHRPSVGRSVVLPHATTTKDDPCQLSPAASPPAIRTRFIMPVLPLTPSPPPRALQPLVLKGEQWTYHTAPANSRSESMTKRPTDHNPFRTLRCLRSKETSYSRHWQIPALTKIYLAGSSLTASPFKAIRRQNRYKWIPG